MNNLLELITENNVIYNLEAVSKEEVIQKLVDHGVLVELFSDDLKNELIESLMNREKSMSTGIGSGVAIPHCSVTIVDELKVVIGISKQGIDFESIDKLPVHIFILLIVPKEKFQEHIKTLALIAKTLNSKE
ncbi:MAG: PTS sugar transporter subunit IIA, partial [Leptospiraceae bacterium]|nr:PTS sugar transporter subunit IIA [Leptospiraceae bacterium]